MPLATKDKSRIVKEESAKFLDSQFGGLDLSGSPDLQCVPLESFEVEDKHGFSRVDTSGMPSVNRLKEFINSPDNETLQRIAEETNDQDLIERVRDAQATTIAQQFTARHPEYLSCDENLLKIINSLAHKHLGFFFEESELDDAILQLTEQGVWNLANVELAYRELLSEGLLSVPANFVRRLNRYEQLEVIRLSQTGQVEAALQKYLACALGDDNPSVSVATDPELVPTCDAACWFVFSHAVPDFVETPERLKFMKRFSGGRPLTIQILYQAWTACKEAEKLNQRNTLIGLRDEPTTREAIAQSIDELDDNAVNSLWRSTRKEISRTSRGQGVLE